MKKVYITGISGTGKSTIAKKLNEYGVFAVDLDDVEGLCKWVHKNDKSEVLTDEVINFDTQTYECNAERVKEILAVDKQIVVVGIAGNQKELLPLFDAVLLLKCDPATFLSRVDVRTDNDFGKKPHEKEFLVEFYKDFNKEMLTLGAVPIDAADSLDNVVKDILSKVQ